MTKQTIQDRVNALVNADPSNMWRLLGLMVAAEPVAAARNIETLEGWQAREDAKTRGAHI